MPSESDRGPRGRRSGETRRLHPLTLLFEAFDEAGSLLIPAVIGGAWVGGGHMARMAGWILVLLVVPSLVWAVAEYLAFRYRVVEGDLVLESGVLRRQHRVIPLARVQSIDVRRSALQRLLGVAELHVETAGGVEPEAALAVLSAGEAEALRAELLSRRPTSQADAVPDPAAPPLARLSVGDLALAGATANEAGVIAALLVGGAELAYQFGPSLPIPGMNLRALVFERPAPELAWTVLLLGLAILPLAWIFSVAGALLSYHGFTLERLDRGLRTRYGALARREVNIPVERVQTVRVRESLLRRPLRLAALQVETAGSAPGQGQHRDVEAYLPLARTRDVPRLIAALFPDLDFGVLRFRPVHPRARIRTFLRYVALVIALAVLVALLFGAAWLWLLASAPLAWAAAGLHVRHLGYALAPGYVVLRAGFLTRTTWIVPEGRIQTLNLRETRPQRRLGLATFGVDTAAGEAAVADLAAAEARELLSIRRNNCTSARAGADRLILQSTNVQGATTMAKVKDPVCGMMIEPANAVATSDYEEQRFYFCSQDCKVEFDENPEDYADEGGQPL